MIAAAALGAAAILTAPKPAPGTPSQANARQVAAKPTAGAPVTADSTRTAMRQPKSLEELLALAPEELAEVDVALVNLLCAEGLPGSEDLDILKILGTLDEWAHAVKVYTAVHFDEFRRNPAQYNHLEGDFRMLALITVLQKRFGVQYNVERARDLDFGNSKDQFLHGLVGSDNGGTCVSMPVLYVAVGRRLGYPLKLVQAKQHVFCRWEGDGAHLNIEGAGVGMTTHDDAFYRGWPLPISDEEMERGYYLRSLTPCEELAVFLAARGHCLTDHRRLDEALVLYREAAERLPTPDYRSFIDRTLALKRPPRRPMAHDWQPMPGMPDYLQPQGSQTRPRR